MDDLKAARSNGKADNDELGVLDLINHYESLYTTSSCLGRTCVLETKKEHDKLGSRWLDKWHREITSEEIIEALRKNEKGVAYLQTECPILHVVSKDLEGAKSLLNIALESGFKRSGIHGLNEDRILIEVCSTETLEAPLAMDGARLTNDGYVERVTEFANLRWLQGQKKLKRLKKALEEKYTDHS